MPRTRKKPITPKHLSELEKELKRRATVARALRVAMENKGIESKEVDGTAMLEKSYGYIDTFLLSCKKELGEL